MLPAGHSHLPAATMGSAAATASTRMACKGSLQWLARFLATTVACAIRRAPHGPWYFTMWYTMVPTLVLPVVHVGIMVKSSNKLSHELVTSCATFRVQTKNPKYDEERNGLLGARWDVSIKL